MCVCFIKNKYICNYLNTKCINYSNFEIVVSFINIYLKKIFQLFISLRPRYLVHFNPTYIYDRVFSTTKINKSKIRTRITIEHLHAVLRTNSIKLDPNIYVFCSQKQARYSHYGCEYIQKYCCKRRQTFSNTLY